jgi:uncharacterized protein YkwD
MFPGIRPEILLFALLLGVFCQSAVAQEVKTQPVARLIGVLSPSRIPAERPAASTATGPALADASEIERRAFEATNLVRTQNGLAPLVWDAEVCRMARSHSENMSRLGFFSHTTPTGLRLRDRARVAGLARVAVIAENIAYSQGYNDPGAYAVESWMLSPKHRENIMSREFRAMAIGSFVAPDGSVYLTQTFITR